MVDRGTPGESGATASVPPDHTAQSVLEEFDSDTATATCTERGLAGALAFQRNHVNGLTAKIQALRAALRERGGTPPT